ncbi:MAG: phage capsid protein [Oscillospiraceae bacterium]|nr:phage capsid protein [Oscillospiraceae bacterium]
MAITLAEAKVGMADKVDQQVVDMFRRSSLLLDNMIFDNSISPGTGGSTLTYGYIQLKTPATANIRTINAEYTPGEAKREKKTTGAIIMGGSFQVDRVLQNTAGAADEMAFQAEQKIKATANYFHNLVINGSSANEEGFVGGTFDGLKKLLTGTQNEITSGVALKTSAELDDNYNAFLDEMDSFISCLDGAPSMLLMNRQMLVKLRSIARRAGYYERTKDDFGRVVETYAGIPMVDMGQYFDGSKITDVVATDAEGKTAIYAVSLGLDGFHGISPLGDGVINSYMPDLNAPGAVKTGEVELVAGVALKNTLKAAVLKGISVGTAA